MRPQTPQKRIVTEVVTFGATSICPHFCPQSTGGGGNIKLPPPLSLFNAAYPAGAPAGVASRLGREATPVSTRAFALVPILELIMIIKFFLIFLFLAPSNFEPKSETRARLPQPQPHTSNHCKEHNRPTHGQRMSSSSSAASTFHHTGVISRPWAWCTCLKHHSFHTESCIYLLSNISECLASKQKESPSEVLEEELWTQPSELELQEEEATPQSDSQQEEEASQRW